MKQFSCPRCGSGAIFEEKINYRGPAIKDTFCLICGYRAYSPIPKEQTRKKRTSSSLLWGDIDIFHTLDDDERLSRYVERLHQNTT